MKLPTILIWIIAALIFAPPLAAFSTITGTITSQLTGNPISGATVELIKGNTNIVDTTTTALDGSYSFNGINPGNYTIRASASGFQTGLVGAKATNNQITIADLALAPNPGTIAGQVTDFVTTLPISGQLLRCNTFAHNTATSQGTEIWLDGLESSVNGQTTPAGIITQLAKDNSSLFSDEIFIL